MDVARGFRVASGSPFDFIASQSAATYLTDQFIVGDIPPATYGRIKSRGRSGRRGCPSRRCSLRATCSPSSVGVRALRSTR